MLFERLTQDESKEQRSWLETVRAQDERFSLHHAGATGARRSLRDLRKSEIENLDAAPGEQDVTGFQVAVKAACSARQ
jgi:hypothetical protein